MRVAAVPSKREFKRQFGVGSIRRSLPKGSMHRISKLLELHDASVEARASAGRLLLLHDIELHSHYALRHPKQSGLAGKQQRIDSVKALQHSVRGELCKRMRVRHFSDARSRMANQFGIHAFNHHADEDSRNNVLYMNLIERKEYLLHFVNGYVCMTDSSEAVDQSIVYDTDYEASLGPGIHQLEHGGAPFVLSKDLKLYVAGRDVFAKTAREFKHTSFLSGKGVLAAGTMRCENGVLKWISAKSGHYQPTSRHMLTMLEFLRAKHIDLKKVIFFRVFSRPLPELDAPGKGEFDGCNAMEFLRERGFPGPDPHSMFIMPAGI